MNARTYFWPRLLLLLLVIIAGKTALSAQALDHIQGELLVQLAPGTEADKWFSSWNSQHPANLQLLQSEIVSRPARIWLLTFATTRVREDELRKALRADRSVQEAQYNHQVELRATPNDAAFNQQWQYQNTGQSGGTVDADIDAVEAWNLTTGGITSTGDTIVVAVLDNGIDVNHVDLQHNRWYNHAEIPNNGLDDDGNGYIDDYRGWNILSDNDDISVGGHGTSVAGIIGADGNNSSGVTGVNWSVKVMIIRNNFNTSEARVLEAYSYALEQRLRYNESGGATGAFVVATNASWGVERGNPTDAPIWCGFYDMLGEAGIINCGATVNKDFNIEITGDLPTGCTSDYLISVTNTDHNDVKVPAAGYGAVSIDLSAPGNGVYTLANGSSYSTFGGTSSATPHVAGTAALLYSLDCPSLMALVQADPAAAALLIKEAILAGVDPIPSLAGITVTGGRLNANNSLRYLQQRCAGCLPASSFRLANRTATQATLTWNTNDSLASVDIRYRAVGTTAWTLLTAAQSPLLLTGLTPCQAYEYQLQSNCFSSTIPFQNSQFFTTDGCCDPPANIEILNISNESVYFSWDAVFAAQGYQLRWREQGTTTWETITTDGPSWTVEGLGGCVVYEYQLRTFCIGTATDWTPIQIFLTAGCGPCLELDYCVRLNILSTDAEYIQRVEIGGFFSNSTTGSPTGYQDFGLTLPALNLEAGGAYPIRLTPGYPTTDMFPQAWRIWLDTDHNGSFNTNEIIFQAAASSAAVDGVLNIPAATNLGVTRMRVLMQFNVAGSPCPFTMDFGEIEDYCVAVVPSSNCSSPTGFVLDRADFTSATISWTPVAAAIAYEADFRASSAIDWQPLLVTGNSAQVTGLDSCASYLIRVKTSCTEEQSLGYSTFEFNTCTVGVQAFTDHAADWQVAPNPFRDVLQLNWLNPTPPPPSLEMVLFDATGRRLRSTRWPNGQLQWTLDTTALPAGLYTIGIFQQGQLWQTRRVVKTD